MIIDRYVKFEWKGSQEVENGVAVFTVLESERLEVELTHFGAAHDIFKRMEKIAGMAFRDGEARIKSLVQSL
jgi:hypothetical protein